MFDPPSLAHAVDMQARSHRLLRWVADAIGRGFISFDAAHAYAALPEAARAWLDSHWADLPPNARPPRDALEGFARFFATYLETSFELVRDPGKRLHSPEAHCFCPMCSWLVDAPRLRTKKITPADRARAAKLKLAALHALAAENDHQLDDDAAERLLDDRSLREPLSLVAYGRDLLERLRGRTEGAATLVLWRGFAWTKEGSPRKDFTLDADAILAAEAALRARIAGP